MVFACKQAKCAQNARNHAFWAKNINRILKNIGIASGEGRFWNFSAQKHSFFEVPLGLYLFYDLLGWMTQPIIS